MQDIPRNELLDKLAAGWKVRTKVYGKNALNNLEELQGIDLKCLIEDDWEGEPPGPVRKYEGCSIVFALKHLKEGAAFIRRTFWDREKPITSKSPYLHLSVDDIISNDWEVWG